MKVTLENNDWLIFDIDGVLIDVSESFDLVVKKTVNYFTSVEDHKLTLDLINSLRGKGVFGDDFKLTEALVIGIDLYGSAERVIQNFEDGKNIEWVRDEWSNDVDQKELKYIFNTFYLGKKYGKKNFDTEGLWKKEKPLVNKELLKRSGEKYRLGVITGRDLVELRLAEDIIGYKFIEYVTRDEYIKPDPRALQKLIGEEIDDALYVGDSLTDNMLVKNYNSKYDSDVNFLKVDKMSIDINDVLECLVKE